MSNGLIELPDGSWRLPLVGLTVNQVCLGYQVDLRIAEALIQIEQPFTLSGDHEADVDPQNAATLGPAIVMLRRVVSSAIAAADGSLVLDFEGGLHLTTPSSSEYEAWNAVGSHAARSSRSDQWRVVSMPGGELAVWT
jgi:hypothetical protein